MTPMSVFRVLSLVAWTATALVALPAVYRCLAKRPCRYDADLTLNFALAVCILGLGGLGFLYPATVRAMSSDEVSYRTALYAGMSLVGCGFACRSRRHGCG